MTTPSILVVEDDARTAETVALYLRHAGYRVVSEGDGEVGLERALHEPFDLVILDRMLPGVDGGTICRRLRERSEVPVLLVTAMVEERDRLDGFDLGADDYITKPFSPRELVARVRAVLRRSEVQGERSRGVLRVGRLTVDAERAEARHRSRLLSLSPTEFRILETLARAPGRVFDRGELIDRAIEGEAVDPRVVDAHIKNLRRKIEATRAEGDDSPSPIETVFGRGYKLVRRAGR